MLEAASFDFRNRHPQMTIIKIGKHHKISHHVMKTAWDISIDLHRTFAPLKQLKGTMAIACLELAARVHQQDVSLVYGDSGISYKTWSTSRAEIMGKSPSTETLAMYNVC